MNETDCEEEVSRPAIIESAGASLNDADYGEIRQLIERSGAVLLRGFDANLEGFAHLGNAMCSSASYNESPNRETLRADGSVQTVNLGADPFPLHPELAREPWRPDLACFACLEPPEVGGQTNVCDGIAIARGLPRDIHSRLSNGTLYYIKPASPAALDYWLGTTNPADEQLANPPSNCPYWFRRGQGQILRGFTRPALEPTLFQEAGAFVNFALFARDYLRKPNIPLLDGQPFSDEMLDEIRSVARSVTYSHVWQKGDVVLLDNSRFMHGRKAIANPHGRRIATFFGYLKGVERPGVEPPDPIWRRETFVPPDKSEAKLPGENGS